MLSRRMMMAYIMSHQSRLPVEFQEVEYIQSTGTQYIDTGVSIDNPRIKCKIQTTNNTGTANQTVFGRQDFGFNKFLFTTNASKFIFFSVGSNLYPNEYTSGEIFIADISKTNQDINGVANTRTDTSTSTDGNIWIAKCGSYSGKYRYYYLQILDEDSSNEIIRDFIPCYRKADNEIGLYDLVNGVFYTNAGTGDFTKGPNV